jgi:iron complex outermembrane receptor protein
MQIDLLVRASLLASVGAVALAAAPAFAAEQDAPAAADAPAAEGTGNSGLTEIVVTATKRETNLQKTPISISVMGAETIKERKVQSLLDLADGGVPSLRVATFEARQSALTIGIRGIVPLDANQPAREQGVGVYIDGVYLGRQHGLNTGLFDIERVEVLKGPQGTLFGRNTEGGALSLVSKTPTGEFGGSIDGGVGNIGSRNAAIHLNLPQFAGFSIKLDGVYQHQDAITKNPLADQAGWGYFNRKGFRAAVRWQPVEGVTNDFSYDVARDENTPFYSQLLNYNPNNCVSGGTNAAPIAIPAGSTCITPGTAFTGTQGTIKALPPGVVINGDTLMRTADIGVPQQNSVDKTHGFTNVLKWKVSPELELRSITAWRGVNVEQYDNSGGYHRVPVVNYTSACAGANCAFSRYSLADLHQNQFSQELQAVGTIGPVDYVAGLYYFNEHVSDDAATPNSMGITYVSPTSATFAPIPFCAATNPSTADDFVGNAVRGCNIDRASEVRSKSYAAYGQLTWNASEQLHITVGGRYTRDEKQGALIVSRNIDYRNPANAAILLKNGYTPLDKVWTRFNPMATVAYDFNNDVHGYVKYSTGYRAGGASSRTSDYRAFNPEDVKNYEVGLKADLFNRHARINIAAYMMDRKGSQVDLSTIQPTATGNFNNLVTFNAPGTTKIRGVEADLTVKPTEGLKIDLSYAYTYTDIPAVPVTYSEFTSAGVATGNSTTVLQKFYIVYTPRNAASAAIDYELPEIFGGARPKFHIDANYSQATQSFDQFATKADESFIVNARLSLLDIGLGGGNNKLNVGLWSRNLFNNQLVYRRDPSNSLPSVQSTQASGVPNVVVIGNNSNILGDYGNFNMPRTFGIDASLKF